MTTPMFRKAQPTPGDVHVNTPLTNLSVAYLQSETAFVARRVFPNVPSIHQSNRYYEYDRGHFNRNQMKKRGTNSETAGVGYSVDNTPSYFCDVWGLHHDVPDMVRANADSVIDPDRDATNLLMHQALISQEAEWATAFFTTSIWTTDRTGVAAAPGPTEFLQWNDATSNPIEDVRLGKTTVLQSTGFEPNVLVIGRQVFDKLVDHPDIIDRVKYGQAGAGRPAEVNVDTLTSLFGVRIMVMNAIQNTAAEGATNVHAFIGGKKALLAYVAPSPGVMIPSAGYTFAWSGYLGASSAGTRIRRFRMENLASDRVELEMAYSYKKVGADLGYFFTTAVA